MENINTNKAVFTRISRGLYSRSIIKIKGGKAVFTRISRGLYSRICWNKPYAVAVFTRISRGLYSLGVIKISDLKLCSPVFHGDFTACGQRSIRSSWLCSPVFHGDFTAYYGKHKHHHGCVHPYFTGTLQPTLKNKKKCQAVFTRISRGLYSFAGVVYPA